MKQPFKKVISVLLLSSVVLPFIGGCGSYSNSWPYREDVRSVYVEMFDTKSFRRGHEYVFTDALCKRIEAQTPYKIVADRNIADTILSGTLSSIGQGVLAMERESGKPLENEAIVSVTVNWKDLTNGDIIIEPKDDIKERLGHSPDKLDSLLLSIFGDFKPKPSGVTMVPAQDAFLKRRI